MVDDLYVLACINRGRLISCICIHLGSVCARARALAVLYGRLDHGGGK